MCLNCTSLKSRRYLTNRYAPVAKPSQPTKANISSHIAARCHTMRTLVPRGVSFSRIGRNFSQAGFALVWFHSGTLAPIDFEEFGLGAGEGRGVSAINNAWGKVGVAANTHSKSKEYVGLGWANVVQFQEFAFAICTPAALSLNLI